MPPPSDTDGGKSRTATVACAASTLAGVALVLVVLVLEQELVRYQDLAIALFVVATALLLLAAQLAQYDADVSRVSLCYSAGGMALLIAAAVIAVPPGEMSPGRWVAIAVGVAGALAIALSTLHGLYAGGKGGSASAERPRHADGADEARTDAAPSQHVTGDGDDDGDGEGTSDLPQIDVAVRAFLISGITGLLMAIVALRVGKDASRELQSVIILIAAACPAVLAFLAQRYGWRNRALAPLLAAMGVIHWQWPWPKQRPETVAQATASASATAGGTTAAVVVLIGGIVIVAALSNGSTLTGAWTTSEFVFVDRTNIVDDGPDPAERWTIRREPGCGGADCPLAVVTDAEGRDFLLSPDGDTWVGTREFLGDCAEEGPRPRRIAVRDGYNVIEEIRMTPLFGLGESPTTKAKRADITTEQTWTARAQALKEDCDETGSLRTIATATRVPG